MKPVGIPIEEGGNDGGSFVWNVHRLHILVTDVEGDRDAIEDGLQLSRGVHAVKDVVKILG